MCRWIVSADICPYVEKIGLVGTHDMSSMACMVRESESNGGYAMATYQGRIRLASFSREYLRKAALVVGLFGQLVYECLAYQTPMLVLVRPTHGQISICAETTQAEMFSTIKKNDEQVWIKSLWDKGAHIIMCPARMFANDMMRMQRFKTDVEWFLDHTSVREDISTFSGGLLDGHGIDRIANAIMGLA